MGKTVVAYISRLFLFWVNLINNNKKKNTDQRYFRGWRYLA